MPTKPPKEIGLLLSRHRISLCCYSSWWQSGHEIKKQANKQQICCHKHLSTTWWVLRVGAWGPPSSRALRRPISCFSHFASLILISSFEILPGSLIPGKTDAPEGGESQCICLALPLFPELQMGNLTTFLALRVIENDRLGSAKGILFSGPSEDRKYHISVSFDPFTLSATPRCLYKSPFHCGHKAYRDSNRWGLKQTQNRACLESRQRTARLICSLSRHFLPQGLLDDSQVVLRQQLSNKIHNK